MGNMFAKDPADISDYATDWSVFLPSGDTIASHTVTAASGITKVSSANSTTVVTYWLSGGTAGTWYDVTVQIVTALGRTYKRTSHFQVADL